MGKLIRQTVFENLLVVDHYWVMGYMQVEATAGEKKKLVLYEKPVQPLLIGFYGALASALCRIWAQR